MNIGKLGSSGDFTSDTYNGASIMHRIFVEQVRVAAEFLRKDYSDNIRVLEVDCWEHLRNVGIGGITKSLSTLLGSTMREEFYYINLRLRVLTSI